jgi:Zc3h12a-like Ribonuclease NYN domain
MVLVLISALGVLAALAVPGASDWVMLAGPCLVASIWLWLKRPRRAPAVKPGNTVIIEGSNVMHWDGGVPKLAAVKAVVKELAAQGFTVGVMFDANAGYKLVDRYQDDHELAGRLGLPIDKVLVVPKGTVADQFIWQAAQRSGARVVSADRYRDWIATFPEIEKPGRLIRGGIKDGQVWLTDLDVAV